MSYVSHDLREDAGWRILEVNLLDSDAEIEAVVTYRILPDAGVLRSSVRLTNVGEEPLCIESVSSFLCDGLAGPGGELCDVDVLWAENDWQAESRWTRRRFRDAVPALGSDFDGLSRGRFAMTSAGSWSSGTFLPMGACVNRRTGFTLLWQIEHNGAWHWQVGDHCLDGCAGSYLSLLGPTDIEHHWRVTLSPGDSFESVPAAVAVSSDGIGSAIAHMTDYRRQLRRPHIDHQSLPVIFNDYINTLNADPSRELLLPLIDAAAEAGAECFCIDAGWYAAPGEWWWDAVGEWLPSEERFPRGFGEIIDYIKAKSMVPGIWIEPEVVGVRSPIASSLPDDAFFVKDGRRVVEQDRYHLDLSHHAARQHLDRTVDFLVNTLGVGYIKMDYNIDVAPGTDNGGTPAGAGLLKHNRAFLDWVNGLLDRYPELTLESCASGGMRTDYATLSRFQLHSTSDQDEPYRYPPIAVAAPVAVAPEQAAVWAPPQPDMSDDMITFTMCGALISRVHLSGHLDHMTSTQKKLVADAVSVYKKIREDLVGAVPFWPLGLPHWDAAWLALGMRGDASSYIVVWHRSDVPDSPSTDTTVLRLKAEDAEARPVVLYPGGTASLDWNPESGELAVSFPRRPSACLIALSTPVRVEPFDFALGISPC